MARSQKDIVRDLVREIDLTSIVEMAAVRVSQMFPYDAGSGDQEDYAYASAQCLSELMDIVRSYQSEEELVTWLSVSPTQWYATDGDIRFDITTLHPALIQEWDEMVEEAWENY